MRRNVLRHRPPPSTKARPVLFQRPKRAWPRHRRPTPASQRRQPPIRLPRHRPHRRSSRRSLRWPRRWSASRCNGSQPIRCKRAASRRSCRRLRHRSWRSRHKRIPSRRRGRFVKPRSSPKSRCRLRRTQTRPRLQSRASATRPRRRRWRFVPLAQSRQPRRSHRRRRPVTKWSKSRSARSMCASMPPPRKPSPGPRRRHPPRRVPRPWPHEAPSPGARCAGSDHGAR